MFECRVEEFRRQYHAAIEQEQRPPEHGRSDARQQDKYDQRGKALQAKARLHAKRSTDPLQSKNQAIIKRLVLHQDVILGLYDGQA